MNVQRNSSRSAAHLRVSPSGPRTITASHSRVESAAVSSTVLTVAAIVCVLGALLNLLWLAVR